MKKPISLILTTLIIMFSCSASAQTAKLLFKAGAAKVDITPDESKLPKNIEGIHDRLYSRAIVIDNGITSAALVTVDTGMIFEQLWKNLTQKIEKELGIPAQNILLTPTHTHSGLMGPDPDLEGNIFKSVKMAKEKLQPARIGYGTGVSYVNVNRNIIDPKTRRWWEGPNYDGPSDKTVAVIKFESVNGEPIAVYYNYAMHAVTVGQLDKISGDAPGAASRYIEDSFDDKIIAVWSTGACGDQNPIYFQQTYDLREIRIKDYAKRGIDISNAMPPGGQGLNKQDPTVIKLMNQQKQMILSMGQFIGEEVMHVMRGMERMSGSGNIFGKQKIVSFPGRDQTNKGRAGYEGTYKDGEPVKLRLGLLMIDDIALGTVNAEVFNLIAQRLKKESPLARTMMVTLTNGMANSGYIPNDAAFGYQTFEVLSSRCKPGYAENAIVNGILDLIYEAKRGK
ncbi:neutral/alkaline non-lysosomal ceramidase N-terminal domain-containing protein [Thermodesulfobacteriota bacterium]